MLPPLSGFTWNVPVLNKQLESCDDFFVEKNRIVLKRNQHKIAG
jgi:hypothetical protein